MLTLLFFLFSLVSATVSDCGKDKSLFQLQEQSFTPSPPLANQEYNYWFSYIVPPDVSISSGSSEYSITLNGIPFPSTVDDLCSQTSCPKTSGTYNESSHAVWPSDISGKVVLKLSWFDEQKNLLLCSQVIERV